MQRGSFQTNRPTELFSFLNTFSYQTDGRQYKRTVSRPHTWGDSLAQSGLLEEVIDQGLQRLMRLGGIKPRFHSVKALAGERVMGLGSE